MAGIFTPNGRATSEQEMAAATYWGVYYSLIPVVAKALLLEAVIADAARNEVHREKYASGIADFAQSIATAAVAKQGIVPKTNPEGHRATTDPRRNDE